MREGVSLQPAFEEVPQRSAITGEQRLVLRTPVVCFAFYAADELAAVYPHMDGGDMYPVSAVIRSLHRGDLPAWMATVVTREPDPLGTCPECGGTCSSNQRIDTCRDCR